jgi:predicted lactoylglutathione lyase
MEPRVSLVTLGVSDLARSRAFYEALGWQSDSKPEDGVVFFQSGSMVFGLWSRDELAKDSEVADSGGWGGITLAYNVGSPAEVDAFLARARNAGATIARSGGATFWGGYNGVFIDPDGHPWEIAHNPFWNLAENGDVTLPKAPTGA